MKPALTAAEWARGGVQRGDWEEGPGIHKGLPCLFTEGGAGTWTFDPYEAHQMAALCLHNQEFGFSRSDVAGLRDAADRLDRESGRANDEFRSGDAAFHEMTAHQVREIADRIEALLPPEEP